MPISKKGAKLWFETEEEENAYDDLMMANIEFQETKNDQSNYYTSVFIRSKQEKFFEFNSEVKAQMDKVF